MSRTFIRVDTPKVFNEYKLTFEFQTALDSGAHYAASVNGVANAIKLDGPVSKTQQATIALTSGGTTAGTMHITLNGRVFESNVVSNVTATASDLAGKIDGHSHFTASSSVGVLSLTYTGPDNYDIFINNLNTHFDGTTTDYSAVFTDTTDSWRTVDGGRANPSAYATPGSPLYDAGEVTIAGSKFDPAGGLVDAVVVLTAWYADATNGAAANIRALNLVVSSRRDVLTFADTVNATLTIVETTEEGAFSVSPNTPIAENHDHNESVFYDNPRRWDFDTLTGVISATDNGGATVATTGGDTIRVMVLNGSSIKNNSLDVVHPYLIP